MIHTDGKRLVAPTTEQLHEFAKTIGLHPDKFVKSPELDYYSLDSKNQTEIAKGFGAIVVTTAQLEKVISFHQANDKRIKYHQGILKNLLRIILNSTNKEDLLRIDKELNNIEVVDEEVVSPSKTNS